MSRDASRHDVPVPKSKNEVRVQLEVVEGASRGRTFVFCGHESFLAGRSRRVHFRLPKTDRRISRVHFLVEINPPRCRLFDTGSTNGTRVNGQRVASADLKDGDLIRAGDTVLKVSFLGDWKGLAGAGPAPAATAPGRPPRRIEKTESFHGNSAPAAVSPAPLAPAGREPSPLKQVPAIPGFQIVRELGRGGMGVVYLAVLESDSAKVAIKTIRPSMAAGPHVTQRFLREVQILEQLRHPNIVRLYSSGQTGDLLYFVMDYVPGTDAGTVLKRQGPLPVGRAVRLLCQTLEALHYAHARGFVHRDVKPSNLLVSAAGSEEVCTLTDFGLARVYQQSALSGLTMIGDVCGTIPYMAPEQITDYRSSQPPVDQYAAAATLYRLLTDRYLFDFDDCPNHARITHILCDAPVPIQKHRPEVPKALATAIHRALEKDAGKRFPDVEAFRAVLAPFAARG
jgi:serine/threonine-protein kinase